MATTRNGAAAHTAAVPWSVLMTRTRTVVAGRGFDVLVLDPAVERVLAAVDVQQRGHVDVGRERPRAAAAAGLDDDGAEQAALDLLVRELVRVVPVRPGVLGPEAVDVAPARRARRPA